MSGPGFHELRYKGEQGAPRPAEQDWTSWQRIGSLHATSSYLWDVCWSELVAADQMDVTRLCERSLDWRASRAR